LQCPAGHAVIGRGRNALIVLLTRRAASADRARVHRATGPPVCPAVGARGGARRQDREMHDRHMTVTVFRCRCYAQNPNGRPNDHRTTLLAHLRRGEKGTMHIRLRYPAAGPIPVAILVVALVSLTGCHTDIAVRARTRAIAEAAEAPNPPDRALVLQIRIATPSADACRQVSSALPQRARAYGIDATNIKCADSEFGHFAEFSTNVPIVLTPNKSGVIKGPIPDNVLFQAFVATFSHVMRARRMGTGYAVTLLYNQPLFASLQADLAKENPIYGFDLSQMHLSLELENDLGTNEVIQISSAFVGGDPIVHSQSYALAPQQSINAIFSDVAIADFAKRHYMTLASFYPAD
jgi:hypothetical protein